MLKFLAFLKKDSVFFPILGFVAALVWFVSTNFVTVWQQEKAVASMKEYVDGEVRSQKETLAEIKTTLTRIDQRVYDLHKKRRSSYGN